MRNPVGIKSHDPSGRASVRGGGFRALELELLKVSAFLHARQRQVN